MRLRALLVVAGLCATVTTGCIGGGDDAETSPDTSVPAAQSETVGAATPAEILDAAERDLAAVDRDLAEASGALGE
jgi:hypothetical protein